MESVAEAVRERPVFRLLNEQQTAYEHIDYLVRRSRTENTKEVVIIVGGPGTGKSAIALELLGGLSRDGFRVAHATGSKTFTETLRVNLQDTKRRSKDIFQYFYQYAALPPNELDVLICDEAHRIRANSLVFRLARTERRSNPQVKELINGARVPVFLIDDDQLIRGDEVGSVAMIKQAAQEMGCAVTTFTLNEQFRCAGSREYITWVDRLLGVAEGGPLQWTPIDDYELHVAEHPAAMEKYLRERIAEGYSARIAAGYCWPWTAKHVDGALVNDVVIGDWTKPWNAKTATADAPPASLWATDPKGFEQVGCVYTAQGFEYDYAGVIIGPDLRWTGAGWTPDRDANRDKDIRKLDDFPRLARNIYRVLATRGMQGTVIHSTDATTTSMLKDLGVPLL